MISSKIIIACIVFLQIVFVGRVAVAETFEPNETVGTAYRMYAGPKSDFISTSTDVDFYSVWIWRNLEFLVILNPPLDRDYDLELRDSANKVLVASRQRGNGLQEVIRFTPTADRMVFVRVSGFGGQFSTTARYTVWARWTQPWEVLARYASDYINGHRTWFARPWAAAEGGTQLAAPQQADTHVISMVSSGAPYGWGNKDMVGHAVSKLTTNNSHPVSSFHGYWWPTERRTQTFSPNVFFSSGQRDRNGQSDAIRHSGETDFTRRGWVGVDCSGLVQRAAWLAGYRASDSTAHELGRIGSLDGRGTINMNTWGGEVGASWFAGTAHAQNVTGWESADGTNNIPILPGMGSIRRGDIVVYRTSAGTVTHVAVVSVPGTTRDNTFVVHSVWRDRQPDPVTGTNFWRRAAQTPIPVMSIGTGAQFQIRRLSTLR